MKPYPYRGFMLDTARHFMPAKDVCKIIEAAAVAGMNRMHWHLTDDQGWRLEIKRYPNLTAVGADRGPSYFGDAVSETENNRGFYTQEDVRRVVAFAQTKGVEIVPEIEVPGHASAMLAAYPQYGCRRTVADADGTRVVEQPYTYRVMTYAGVFPNLICAGRDDAVQFLLDILDEVTDLFPGPEVHIGGDEAVKMHWRRCPDCQRRMKEEHLKDEHELQRWLVLRVGEYLREKGKKTVVWNESLDGGLLPKHFIVQHWLGSDAQTAAFMAEGGQVVCSDVEHYYVSRPFSATDAYGIWAAPLVPGYAQGHEENLLGLECCLWSEKITNTERAAYQLFPRMPAVALKAARPDEYQTWEDFEKALEEIQARISPLDLPSAPRELWKMPRDLAEQEKAREKESLQSPRIKRVFEICDGILLQEALEKLLRAIDMPWDFALRVIDCAWAGQKEFAGDDCSAPILGADELADQLLTAIGNRQNGPWKDLPEDILLDTLKCFTRFVREHYASCGVYGFDRGFWTTRQINARLFRIGELEYELREEADRRFLSLHIPSDAKLESGPLNESAARAKAFLAEYFPAWADAPMELETWLLSPALRQLLPASSRILRFQQAFDIQPTTENALEAVLQWVYRLTPAQQKDARISQLPENTSLQRTLKAYLLSGGQIYEGWGLLSRPFQP